MPSKIIRSLSISTVILGLLYVASTTPNSGLGQTGAPNNANSGFAQGTPPIIAVAPAHVASSGQAMMASSLLSNGFQQIVLYDQTKQAMAVYHIDPVSSDIQLKSVRKLDADLALQEFNLGEPTPSTIRKNVR